MSALLKNRIKLIATLNLSIFMIGVLGYVFIEGWSVGDAMFMTIITVGSVGYGEVRELSAVGRAFTGILIAVGVGTLGVSFTLLVDSMFSAENRREVRRKRMQRKLNRYKDHVIICGYGRVGRNAYEVLQQEKHRDVVVIEFGEEAARLRNEDITVLEGDATEDAVLREAGIDHAWGLLVATGNDSVNLFVVLSARALNPDLTIVARSSSEENDAKMIRAGANRVVSPYDIGGKRMAHSLMRPHLTEFLDVLTTSSGHELFLEEVDVADTSGLAGNSLREIDLRQRTGVTLLAVLRKDGVVTPDADFRFDLDDSMIVIGTRQQLDRLEALIA